MLTRGLLGFFTIWLTVVSLISNTFRPVTTLAAPADCPALKPPYTTSYTELVITSGGRRVRFLTFVAQTQTKLDDASNKRVQGAAIAELEAEAGRYHKTLNSAVDGYLDYAQAGCSTKEEFSGVISQLQKEIDSYNRIRSDQTIVVREQATNLSLIKRKTLPLTGLMPAFVGTLPTSVDNLAPRECEILLNEISRQVGITNTQLSNAESQITFLKKQSEQQAELALESARNGVKSVHEKLQEADEKGCDVSHRDVFRDLSTKRAELLSRLNAIEGEIEITLSTLTSQVASAVDDLTNYSGFGSGCGDCKAKAQAEYQDAPVMKYIFEVICNILCSINGVLRDTATFLSTKLQGVINDI